MSDPLQPGDLCVVISHPEMEPMAARYVGLTVVLIEIAIQSMWLGTRCPYWRCVGLPPTIAISHVALRKIPPDRMLDARTHMTDETNEEELTV